MSDRAPDGQPTENIQLMLQNVKLQLEMWEQTRAAEERSAARSTEIIIRQRKTVKRLEKQLAIRLAEEAATVEVTGL